ncbi:MULTISPECIES: F420-non-reducing hydrogenase subunit MvhA [Methanobacterium]|jgi:F420-non-reducing hydrogenase large subunit|uniref:F420-non-reducing hydrogenase subunit A n=1 Tax=Methanobacterium formicicum TaxID=2162 RepID=A0A090I2R9_METFO|nr:MULTISPECIES: F420-non-reducing hydrogenase subunit MvhA [Methanobacterium]KUK74513.1 MAG: Methyl viologen-reducing hydrogenase subunit alpha [Methanobacterium sp. 42_16]MDH2659259.1 F420-non-reducing hydrogenase subunit MvhA [Methanobacterium formicicum]CEA13234.1 F420-non-reducing hydrogenase subunit A [Methanobacterium formicicum]
MVTLKMEPVTRIEGHAKITVDLDDAGNVQDTKLHVMEFRGFEKFLQGRNIEEVPRLVPRICGICDVQHHLAAAKAVDACFGFAPDEILPTAYKMREIMSWGSVMHSHALHFYFLAAPDFIAGKDRKTRNVFQIVKDAPDAALQAIELRKNALDIIKATGGRPIHPTSSTPGGISTSLDDETQKDLLQKAQRNVELSVATLELAKPIFEENLDLVKTLGYVETYHTGLVKNGVWDMYDGNVRMKDKEGNPYVEFAPSDYLDYIAEKVKPYSWLKFPYIKDLGYPDGIYRVAPLSRLNVADKMPDAAPLAQEALNEFRDLFGYAQEPLLFHWARLIELLAASECAADALEGDLSGQKFPDSLERTAGEGVGIVEASRGTLTHHYACDENGNVTKANIVVATIQNNPAMEMGIQKVAQDYIKPGVEVDDKIFNLMEMVIRAYDPCLSCATHEIDSQMRLATLEVYDSEGHLVKRI